MEKKMTKKRAMALLNLRIAFEECDWVEVTPTLEPAAEYLPTAWQDGVQYFNRPNRRSIYDEAFQGLADYIRAIC